MKAIKFVILGAGVLAVLAFFLPYAKVTESGSEKTYSAFDIVRGNTTAEDEVRAASQKIDEQAVDSELGRRAADDLKSDVQKTMDRVKGVLLVLFAPAFLMLVIGGVGAGRGKLERLGGIGALVLGLLGMGANGLFLAAWGSSEVHDAGGGAAIAQYLLMIACTIGFVCGLLVTIKPDRGGRFG